MIELFMIKDDANKVIDNDNNSVNEDISMQGDDIEYCDVMVSIFYNDKIIRTVETVEVFKHLQNDNEQEKANDINYVPGTCMSIHEEDGYIQNKKKERESKKDDTRERRNDIKLKKNSGDEYKIKIRTMVNKRVCIPLIKCRANCQEKIDCKLQQKIFTNYWSFKSYDRRITFIYSLIASSDKITQRKRRNTSEKQKNRVKTYHYSIPKDGINVLVCRGCLLKIFGETDKFIRNICLKKINSPVNTCSPDKRGKAVPRNKYSPEVIKSITDHIDKLPAYESHYCRRETSKKYLPSHFTLQHIYEEYSKTVEKPVSRTIYHKYFQLSGLKIKSPKKDTCSTCDKLKIQLTNANCSNEQNIILKNQQIQHHNDAEEAYNIKKQDIATSSDNHCCLPTPSLESSVAFYKRQLWTFNFTIHDTRSSFASNYIKNEILAKRGANDIDSSLYHYLNNLPSNASHVTMYSDCCPGQNKNGIIMAMCLYFLERQENVKIIDHKFIVSGHSRMECDSDHARIEKAEKRYPFSINHPHDWLKLINWVGKDKFINTEMKQDHFFDFSNLLKTKYQMKKKNENGEIFLFRDVKWFRYVKKKDISPI
ncbi:hypothetical protein AGLY_016264 [Aphis glycines]|uniref:Uncharacterized protein n=1 Tax=Aphis glycines TaxID=307491 RepID=A0A6G0SY65_APHGL|nr:hypothetical protein AGLY_016264 [Aphis glycines]